MSPTGKLKFCVNTWKEYTDDPFILQTVSGFCKTFQFWIPQQIDFSPEQKCIVDNEITELLSKGVIESSDFEKDQFISNIFIVPKPNGKDRPVIYLPYLNYFVHYEHFKQETFKVVLNLIQEDDFSLVLIYKNLTLLYLFIKTIKKISEVLLGWTTLSV